MALITLGAVVSYDYGLLTYLFAADESRITVLIAVLYGDGERAAHHTTNSKNPHGVAESDSVTVLFEHE